MEHLDIYCNETPGFIMSAAATPPMQRLKNVGMNCGCEYTSFPTYRNQRYSRYDHSLGVALIVWNFTHDKKQALAGLFHDIATPAFSHVIDFLNGDYVLQETTENGTREIIQASEEITSLLDSEGISLDEVADYHIYPIADNNSPQLSADRLEYTLGNMLNYGFNTLEDIKSIYNSLTVTKNEEGIDELAFTDLDNCMKFANGMMKCSYLYVRDEDRYAMQFLALTLKMAIECGAITLDDLYFDEPHVISKLQSDTIANTMWKAFRSLKSISRTDSKDSPMTLKIDAKKRYINPLAGNKRLTDISDSFLQEVENFKNLKFNYWLTSCPYHQNL